MKIATTKASSGFYDVPPPPQVSRDTPTIIRTKSGLEAADYVSLPKPVVQLSGPVRELHLELQSALEALVIHQQEVQAATQLLFSCLGESREGMRVPSHTLLNSVTTFYNFSQSAVQSAKNNAQDPKIAAKLERLVQNMSISFNVIAESCSAMDKVGWTQQKQGKHANCDTRLSIHHLSLLRKVALRSVRQRY